MFTRPLISSNPHFTRPSQWTGEAQVRFGGLWRWFSGTPQADRFVARTQPVKKAPLKPVQWPLQDQPFPMERMLPIPERQREATRLEMLSLLGPEVVNAIQANAAVAVKSDMAVATRYGEIRMKGAYAPAMPGKPASVTVNLTSWMPDKGIRFSFLLNPAGSPTALELHGDSMNLMAWMMADSDRQTICQVLGRVGFRSEYDTTAKELYKLALYQNFLKTPERVSADFANAVLEGLCNHPFREIKLLKAGGYALACTPHIVDLCTDLKGVPVPDSKKGNTFDQAVGIHNSDSHVIAAAEFSRKPKVGGKVDPEENRNYHPEETASHEIAHARDHLDNDFSNSPEFLAAMRADISRMSPRQQTKLGDILDVTVKNLTCQRAKAELFAHVYTGIKYVTLSMRDNLYQGLNLAFVAQLMRQRYNPLKSEFDDTAVRNRTYYFEQMHRVLKSWQPTSTP